MKKHLLAIAVTALAAGSVFAQANDTLAKIKASGSVTLGVRESSGLSYTWATASMWASTPRWLKSSWPISRSNWACPSWTSSTSPSPRKTACPW